MLCALVSAQRCHCPWLRPLLCALVSAWRCDCPWLRGCTAWALGWLGRVRVAVVAGLAVGGGALACAGGVPLRPPVPRQRYDCPQLRRFLCALASAQRCDCPRLRWLLCALVSARRHDCPQQLRWL
ncbi:hypothetical protein SSP24_46520 [Streptomyces spinoverrucosus]|uniref:Uncharacterized protein n=1 Tax=Streptomyces spinoverrucosus TaxID=284043 RepID=A0A4Y3VJG4_9ACTN|nr:hypothetical protein SSP24_46520 [Streptomyces spinoverrucosus]GHB92711.1 hypothetical protein GCM10010397_76590 [Streptomyces spinoverrucosus]